MRAALDAAQRTALRRAALTRVRTRLATAPVGDAQQSRANSLATRLEPLLKNRELGDAAKRAIRALRRRQSLSFARTVVVGASVSAGVGGETIADALKATLVKPGEIRNLSDVYFFRRPAAAARIQLSTARRLKPTVVVALDLMFWQVYGDDRKWRSRFDEVLRRIDAVPVPMLLGDIPDMRHAADWMLPSRVHPSDGELDEANRRLRDFARVRLRVELVPLSKWTKRLHDGGVIKLAQGHSVDAKSLLTVDRLHPNAKGTEHLVDQLLSHVQDAFPLTRDDWINKRQ